MKFRSWRDDDGWPTPPTTSEGSTPAPAEGLPIRDVPADRFVVERPFLHPAWWAFAASVGVNIGLIAALALATWLLEHP